MFICIIIDLHLITIICAKLLSISSYITIKMYFFKLYSAIVSTFLILKLFIRCLLVGVMEGLWLGISLSYKWKQIGVFFFEESSMHVYELFST